MNGILAFAVVFSATFIQSSRSLSCYQCKYYERLGRGHYDCKDPDEKYNIDCEDDENVCHYIHGEEEDGFQIWLRQCAKSLHVDSHLGCRHASDTLMGPMKDVVHCYCAEDGCNGARAALGGPAAVAAVAAAAAAIAAAKLVS